jgi:UDP-GlcNAc:undecaprenyl-phosphate GlcNAc-1-phosphate transferase
MTVYLALVLAGLVFGLLLTPLVRSASFALGLLDAPGGRKVHSLSVPRLGGVAVVAAALFAAAATGQLARFFTALRLPDLTQLAPILAGSTLVFAVGVADDVRPLPAWVKLIVQVLAALIVIQADLQIERITIAGQTWELGILSSLVTLAWVVGLTNAFNLIDGIDGLAAGVAVIAGATCALILIYRGHAPEAALLAALVGAALGFLYYNFAPASIFLGDGGSLLFGFVLATTAITGWQKGATALAAGVPILIFALPIADALGAVVRRAGSGPIAARDLVHRIAQPDRAHIHHRLVALGWSTRQAVLLLYALTIILSAIALATAQLD